MPFVVKDRVWPAIGYEPHEGQQAIHHSLLRNNVASCGRRFGKSTMGGHELVPEAIYTYSIKSVLEEMVKKRYFWIVGPDYSDVEKEWRTFYDDLKRLGMPFDRPGTYNSPLQGNMHMSLWDGAFQVHGKSAMHPESLDGEGLSGVLLVEAAKLKPHVWGKFIRPSLADVGGWSKMTSTPEGKNWFYRKWQDGQNPKKKNWASFRMPSWANTRLFPGGRNDPEILDMESDMSEESFKQEIGADFTEFVGRVFKDFDEEVHIKDLPYNPDLPLVIACDFGWTNPFVALAIQWDTFENVYVIAEYRNNHRDITDIAKDLKEHKIFSMATELYPDPEAPGDAAVLERELHLKLNGGTGGELKWRLELIRKHLKFDIESEGHDEKMRKPKLFIDRSCRGLPLDDGGLLREMLDYRYPREKEEATGEAKENPMKKDDHGPEALGRFFRAHFGGPGDDGRGSRARMRRVVIRNG